MSFGSGKYTYEVVEGWGKLPDGWAWGWMPAVACDSQDRVFVYSRSEHPLVIFNREGEFIDSWGEDVLIDAHGIYIDGLRNVAIADRDGPISLISDSISARRDTRYMNFLHASILSICQGRRQGNL